jgi:hypothetical protein
MKILNSIFTAIIAVSMLTAVVSCEKDQGPYYVNPSTIDTTKLPTDTNKTPNDTDTTSPIVIPKPTLLSYTVEFNAHIKPIIQTNCMGQGCHNPSHPALDLRPQVAYKQLLTDGKNAPYVDTLEPAKSIIYLHLVGIRLPMPKDRPKLPQEDIDKIYTWITQGAKNN